MYTYTPIFTKLYLVSYKDTSKKYLARVVLSTIAKKLLITAYDTVI